jgi:hypothetical protein
MLFVCHFVYHMVDGLYINVIGFLIGEDRFSSVIHMTVTKEMNTFLEKTKMMNTHYYLNNNNILLWSRLFSFGFMVFNVTINNISVISWRSVCFALLF